LNKKVDVWLQSLNGDIDRFIIENLIIGANKNVIKFENIDSRDAAEDIRGFKIFLSRKNFPPINDDQFYLADILGFKIFNEKNILIGIVDDILSLQGNDIIVMKNDNKEFLIPLVDEFLVLFDFEDKKIIVNIIEGLLD
tara:strand:+ start:145 stop:561 length:417 start_codon:yes stop_codon:yes gene_type:complete